MIIKQGMKIIYLEIRMDKLSGHLKMEQKLLLLYVLQFMELENLYFQ
jgi:hypothetical protein